MGKLARDVAIIGVGQTRFGEHWNLTFRELGIEAGFRAMEDAGISSSMIEALYIGNMSSGLFLDQEHVSAMIAEVVGLTEQQIPATRIEAAGASGGLAFRQAILDVASGLHDVVVVGGAEKMSDVVSNISTEFVASGADQAWEGLFGATMPSLFALMAKKHMHDHGTTKEHLARVAVKNHANGAKNPLAQFQREISIDMALNASMVADPLGVFDCAPSSDGSASLVLCDMKTARDISNNPIKVIGTGQGSDSLSLANRKEITSIRSTIAASRRAYDMAGVSPKDVQVAEVHDSYTISEIIALEDLGFFEKGDGGFATERGETALNSTISINTSGGLKARGHPLGATGIAQINELVLQLRKEAKERQVKDARIGLAHNMGGTGGTAVVHILEAV